MRDGIDSKAFLLCLLRRMPNMLLIGLTGAILGSGLYLFINLVSDRTPEYECDTEYYIDFAAGRYEAKDYYNAYTWNDVMATDPILDKTMETLGDSYDRETVKNMITAVIMSDVRYLEIRVKGTDAESVEAVSAATGLSLEAYAEGLDEFDAIYQIEGGSAVLVETELFTWRVFGLGFLVAGLLALFVFCVRFGLGESFYTKKDVKDRLGVQVLGLSYANGNQADGIQEIQTTLALEKVLQEKAVLVEVMPGDRAAHFRESYPMFAQRLDTLTYPIKNNDSYNRIKKTQGAILVIPFGEPVLNNITDVMDELNRRECPIVGAVLVDADKRWIEAYYGSKHQKKERAAR